MNLGRRPSPRSALEQRLELVDPHPVLVGRDLDHLGLVAAEDGNRARVGRRLADDDVARVDQRLGDEVDRLLAAGGDEHIVGVGQHPLRAHHLEDAVLGLLEALRRPVLQGLRRGLLRDLRHLRRERPGRERRGVGESAGERDHLRPGRDRHQVAHRGAAHDLRARGEEPGVALEIGSGGVRAAALRRRAHPRKCGASGRRPQDARRPGPSSLALRVVDGVLDVLQALGIGIALGMLAAAAGRAAAAAAILGVILGAIGGAIWAGVDDASVPADLIAGAIGGLIAATHRRQRHRRRQDAAVGTAPAPSR